MVNSLGKVSGMSRASRAIFSLFVCAGLLGAPATTLGQDSNIRTLLDRLERMERDIRSLNLQVSKGEAPPSLAAEARSGPASAEGASSPGIARLQVRLTQLESEVREAIGRAEEVTFQINQLKVDLGGRLDKLVQDVDYRLGVLEQRAGISPGATPSGAGGNLAASAYPPGTPPELAQAPALAPPTTTSPPPSEPATMGTISSRDLDALTSGRAGAPPQTPPAATAGDFAFAAPAAAAQVPLSPQEQYDQARGLLLQARYDEAEQALATFLGQHGDNPLAGNARYWLGETYYVRADYVRAAEVFLEGFQKNPDSPKAPDTLLKLGMSLANLNKNREACAAFDKLALDYPDAPSNIQRLLTRERQKNGCN